MRTSLPAIVVLTLALAAAAQAQTVRVAVDSPQNATSVEPGATIHWTISFDVVAETNIEGLAMLSVDLVQDDNNPERFDLTPGDAVPPHMANFSRPNGVSNPGETDPTTGYTGLLRGTPGQRNLVQIGGAQNTLGHAFPPGTGIAENDVVETGLGLSTTLVLATGSFQAPTTEGLYVFRLQGAVANVLVTPDDPPPAHSPVAEADVMPMFAGANEISFTVGTCQPCDANCDADANGLDVQAFVDAMLGVSTPCSSCAADLDGNHVVDENDITAFLDCLISSPL